MSNDKYEEKISETTDEVAKEVTERILVEDEKEELRKKFQDYKKTVEGREALANLWDAICNWLNQGVGPEKKYDDVNPFVVAETLKAMFYLLLRDYMTVGGLNEVIKSVIGPATVQYSDDILAKKAESLADMILRDEYLVCEIDASYLVR